MQIIVNNFTKFKFEKLEDVLLEYIDENFGNISEKGASYDNLYSIENNKSRKKNVTYNPNTYYLRIYSLFKIYGFLDDYEIFRLLEQNNIAHVDWNALNGDAETNNLSPEFEISRIHETTEGKNSIVVLMHDSPAKSVTADTLPQIIATLRDKGYEFKNFYEIIK